MEGCQETTAIGGMKWRDMYINDNKTFLFLQVFKTVLHTEYMG